MPTFDDVLPAVVAIMREASGLDFGRYRASFLVRRLAHRMQVTRAADPAAYVRLIAHDASERVKLLDALLVKTTYMARDPPTFSVLHDEALPSLIARRKRRGETTIRAWVAGCATGEEAYSLGMYLLAAIEAAGAPLALSVIATDVDASALERAARGVFPVDRAAALPEPLGSRHLSPEGAFVRVRDELRGLVTFTRHDLLDPRRPAPREAVIASFDLVSCRNVLIYLKPDAQEEVATRLVDNCEPGALLILGEAEAVPRSLMLTRRLAPVRPPTRIYEVSARPST